MCKNTDILPKKIKKLEHSYVNGLPLIYVGMAGRLTAKEKNIQCNKELHKIIEEDCLEFFNYRFKKTLDRINNSQLVKGLREEGKELENFAKKVGRMQILIYKTIAIK